MDAWWNSLIWRPFIPPLPLALVAGAVAAMAIFACVRSWRQAKALGVVVLVMRLALIGFITILLMGPSSMPPRVERFDRPKLTVMLDTSASMQTEDMDSLSRFDFAAQRWLSDEQLRNLSAEYELTLIGFDEQARPIAAHVLGEDAEKSANGRISNISQSLADTLTSDQSHSAGSAIVLISDGRDTTDMPINAAAAAARSRSVPVHTVALGGATLSRDIAVVAVPLQQFVFAKEQGKINVVVLQSNPTAMTTELLVECNNKATRYPVHFAGQSSVSIDVPVKQETPGMYEYVISVPAMRGEVETANNVQRVRVPVAQQRIRVLLLEGQPYWDTKYLAQSLRRDERVSLTQISRINDTRQTRVVTRADDAVAGAPKSVDDLLQYDVVVLGRNVDQLMGKGGGKALARWVDEHGGQVVFARGPAYDLQSANGREFARDVAVIEPLVWGTSWLHDQPIALTAAGRTHPALVAASGSNSPEQAIRDMPGLAIMSNVRSEKPTATVFARAQASGAGAGPVRTAAIAVLPYGRGRAMVINGEGLWRWSMRPGSPEKTTILFDGFWSNMVRWMAMGSGFHPGQQISMQLSQRGIQKGDSLTIDIVSRVALDPTTDISLTITDPQGQVQRPALTRLSGSAMRLRAVYEPASAGDYEVKLDAPAIDNTHLTTAFSVYDYDFERLNCAANPSRLRSLAELTNGIALDPRHPEQLLRVLQRQRASMVVPRQAVFIWDRGQLLTAILLWAGIEWIARKKGGLL